jgi:D-amino peptidase
MAFVPNKGVAMPRSVSTRREFIRSAAVAAAGAALPCCVTSPMGRAAENRAKLKIWMHWDMEGTSGLFLREQAWYKGKEVKPEVAEEGIKLLIADVNSAAEAALKAGATELIVCDTHGGGGNFRPKEMFADPRVTYLYKSQGYEGKSFRWMPGMNETVDGLMLMGHHAKAGTPNAFLAHTNSSSWTDFSINAQSVGEIGIEACFAGHWGVPLVLTHGDEAMCKEVEQQFPGAVRVCVKKAQSHDRCAGLEAAAARKFTAEKIAEAIHKLRTAKPSPYKPKLPMRVALRYKEEGPAEAVAKRPGVRRVDAHTVECEVQRQCDVVKWMSGTGVE